MWNPICYWFGCVPDYEHPRCLRPEYVVPCKRCGASVTSYSDRVGGTRHSRAMHAIAFWCWRRWVPAKCPDCHHRFGSHTHCDCLPF